jgi:hypothetical protein
MYIRNPLHPCVQLVSIADEEQQDFGERSLVSRSMIPNEMSIFVGHRTSIRAFLAGLPYDQHTPLL